MRVAWMALALPWGLAAQTAAYLNPDLPAAKRAADLVGRMTLEEKAGQMQNAAPAIERLGIPAYDWWNEALHGVARAGLATVFPQAIGMAAMFDTDLMHRIGEAISTEARAKYNDAIRRGNHGRYYGLTFWSPNVNIFRDPRWGRGQETYGEDPYLTSRLAVEFIRGLQGDDSHYLKVDAMAKHFAVHSGPETSRHEFNVHPSERDLEDTYLPAFRASVEEGKAAAVMCAYNSVDGVPACASEALIGKTLRGAWGFTGYVVSDCGAVGDISGGHKYKATLPEAAAAAVRAGTDLDCGREYRTLVEAVKGGWIEEKEIDRALERLFEARFRLGMFDPAARAPFSRIGMEEVDSAEHRALALKAAKESMVLLKNTGALPLGARVRRIVVTGPGANDPETLLGNYNGIPSHITTPLAGMEEEFAGKAKVEFTQGSTFTEQSSALVPAAVLEGGLEAEYFDNAEMSGKAAVERKERGLYFRWDMQGAEFAARIPHDAFSARWTGVLRVGKAGEYGLGTTRLRCGDCKGNDSARVYLDGRLMGEDGARASWWPRTAESKVHLEAGRDYKLRVEYRQNGGGAGLELVWNPPAAQMLEEAVEGAKAADVTVAFVGLNAELEGEEMKNAIPGFAGGDRTAIGLPAAQEQLLHALFETGKPVVVVLLNGSALAVNEAEARAAAILEAWYPGQDGGTAIAQTLTGENNPAGRLPVMFYRSVEDLPPFDDYSMRGRTYRYFTGKPLFAFGTGLSYSKFEYTERKVDRARGDGKIGVSVRVRNASARDGDEVVRVYVKGDGTDGGALRELRGFRRVHLKAGESRVVELAVDPGRAGVKAGGVEIGSR